MTQAAASVQAARAVQTVADDVEGVRWFGSGYLAAPDLVLTVRHVLHGASRLSVRFVDGPGLVRQVGARVVFADAAVDVAVLQLDEIEQQVLPVAFGYLAGPTACEAVGYPRFKLNDDHRAAQAAGRDPGSRLRYRDSEHVYGACHPDANRYAGTLALIVPAPERDPDPALSPWEGMSGAAVFADGLLIGLVAEHYRREGLGRLTATAVRQWPQLLDAPSWHRLQDLLGISDPAALSAAGAPAATTPAMVRDLPRDIPVFTGRTADLERLKALLNGSGGSALAVHAVDGMAGVGKSAFAIHAGHALAERFPDGQMFLLLHGHTPGQFPLDPGAALEALLAADGLAPSEMPKTTEGKQAMWRHRTADRRMLLVLDDAADTAQVAPLLPSAPHTLVLVTSRRALTGLTGTVPIRMDVLDPDEAAVLLARTAVRPDLTGDDPDVRELAALCGHLPLALSLIGALLAHHPSWSPADVVGDFRQAGSRLEVTDGSGAGVAAALDLSMRDLSSDQRQLFTLLGAHPGTEYEPGAAAALLDTGIGQARRLLAGLEEHRLLNETAVRGRYRMHDLTREHAVVLAAASGDGNVKEAIGRLYGYYQNPTVQAFTTSTADGQPWNREQQLTWARTERDNLLACIAHADSHHHRQATIALTETIAPALEADGPWTQATALHSRAVAEATNISAVPALARALNNLGRVQRLAGYYTDAIASHTQALELHIQLDDRHGQATTSSDLGRAVYMTDDYSRSIQLHNRALELYKQLGDQLGQAGALNALGQIRRMSDDYTRAAENHLQALELHSQLGNRPGQAEALTDLGRVRQLTGDYIRAAEHHQRALELYGQLGEPLGQAEAFTDLGRVHRMTGYYSEAAEYQMRALELYGQLGDRFGQAGALTELGRVRRMTGEYTQAAEHHQQALELFTQLDDRFGQANALHALGSVQQMTNDYAKATDHHQQALELYGQLNNRLGQAEALTDLGGLRRLTGEYAIATEYQTQALELYRELGNRLGQAEALTELGRVLQMTADYAQSADHHQRALELFEQLGDRLGQANALDGLGECSRAQGQTATAAGLLRQALKLYRDLGVPYADNVAKRLAALAVGNTNLPS